MPNEMQHAEDGHAIGAPDSVLAQMSALRRIHEEHVASLKQAHEKEIASHQSYICILERRRSVTPVALQADKAHLTIDTAQAMDKGDNDSATTSASAATSLRSIEVSPNIKRRASAEAAAAETAALKRKLSLSRKAQADVCVVRHERDQLREAAEKSDRRIAQLKGIVKRGKENEVSLRTAVSGYEASLLASNNQRLDALEGLHEAEEQLRQLAQHNLSLKRDRDRLCDRLRRADPTCFPTPWQEDNEKSNGSRNEHQARKLASRQSPLLQQLDQMRKANTEKDARMGQREQLVLGNTQHSPKSTNRAGLIVQPKPKTLQRELEDLERQLSAAKSESDLYNSLLHAELRRQSRTAAHKQELLTGQIQDEVSGAAQRRLRAISMTSCKENHNSNAVDKANHQVLALERELKHCVQEIIMCKLDVKGYKKDLKRATAEIETLKAGGVQLPRTPDTAATKSASDLQTPVQEASRLGTRSAKSTPGLGISLGVPGESEACTYEGSHSPVESSTVAVSSPTHWPRTPVKTDKKLPEPPVSPTTPSLGPATDSLPHISIQRQETLRSLSESIISSYAKRSPAEHGTGETPPPPYRGRISDPLRVPLAFQDNIFDDPSVRLSKYAADLSVTAARSSATAT